jgi:2-keto-3-deoxy-L-rhamnonate aldolase RhmA
MIPNRVKKMLHEGKVVVGGCVLAMRNPAIARIFASAGFDFIYIEMEHGSFSMESVADIMLAARGANIVPLVGPSTIEAYMISRALDAGAMGIIAPHVETREEVELIIKATKYPPMGERGLATRGGHLDYQKGHTAQDIIQTMNQETLVVLKVESGQAIDRLEELITVPGVDAAFIGPGDLSMSLGYPGQASHPKVVEYFEKVIETCNRHDKVFPGLHVGNIDSAKAWIDKGMKLLAYNTEVGILEDTASQVMSDIKSHLASS